MLNNAPVAATIAVRDLDQAKRFYTETLGLKLAQDLGGGAFICEAGRGSMMLIYARPDHVPGGATIASFLVADALGTVAELAGRGVKFEDYDLPDLKTDADHLATMPGGTKAAWFTDPDGNILSLGEM